MRDKTVFLTISVFTMMLLLAGNLWASTAALRVSANVLPWMKMDVTQHETVYDLYEEKMPRNFIDIPQSVTVDISTNVRTVVLNFTNNGGGRMQASVGDGQYYENKLVVHLTQQEIALRKLTRTLDFRVLLDSYSDVGPSNFSPLISIQGY